MITLGDLVFRCVVCLIVVFFFRFLFDVLGVLKRLGRRRQMGKRAAGQRVDVVSDGKDQMVSLRLFAQKLFQRGNAPEANPTSDKDLPCTADLFTGEYRSRKQWCVDIIRTNQNVRRPFYVGCGCAVQIEQQVEALR